MLFLSHLDSNIPNDKISSSQHKGIYIYIFVHTCIEHNFENRFIFHV